MARPQPSILDGLAQHHEEEACTGQMPTLLSACPTSSLNPSAPIPAKGTSRSPPAHLATCYCLVFCVKNFRIQYVYLAVAIINNPLSRSNCYLPELCRKLKTEVTTSYNIPF